MSNNKTLLPAILIALMLSGCATLQREPVKFTQLSDCPKLTADKLVATQQELGPMTDMHALACALDFVRSSKDTNLKRSALGSRLCLHLAERETEPDKREKLAAEGVNLAEAAVAAGGDGDGAVHYFLAANLGLAVRDHLTLAINNLTRLESEMKKALALSPDIDSGGPMRLLGMLYVKAPAWPEGIGDRDKGKALLEQAVQKFPNYPLNHLFLAQAILAADDEGAAEQAKAEFARGEKLLAQGQWGYSLSSWENEFNDFRDELGNEPVASVKPPVNEARK